MSAREITTEPTNEPVTTAEAKAYLNLSHSLDDTMIDSFITAARKKCETHCGRAFVNTTYALYLDCFPNIIQLTPAQVNSVSSIVYLDEAGDSQTLSSALYTTDLKSRPARITPAYGQVWPSTYPQMNAVTVTYVCGFGASAANVPEAIKTAIKMLMGHVYTMRGLVAAGVSVTPIPWTVDAMLDPYKACVFAGALNQ